MFFISSIFPINLFFIIYIALHFQTIVYEKNQPELAHFILVKLVDYILALRRNNPNDPARFVETIMNNENGEVIETTNQINQEKIDEEARYDGIYAISTNLEDDDVSKIIQISERRWQIEECFRILKTEFKARPIYLQLEDRIDAHFLTCFCSLLVIRLLSNKLDNKYTIGELLETLRTMELTDTDQGSYLPSYTRTALTDDLHETFGFRTDYQILLKKKVRSIIKSTK